MEREDATPLSILDRFELVKTAILMIDEGIDYYAAAILSEHPDTDMMALRHDMMQLRSESYINMLHTFANNQDEAKQLIHLLRLENSE